MIKKVISLLYIVLGLILSASCFGQQGNYERKSISSLESVWFKANSLEIDFNIDTFMDFMKFYVEVDRFDYNIIPDKYTSEFRDQANSISNISEESISLAIEKTITAKILEILNTPEIQEARSLGLKTEAELKSFAVSKANSFGLTSTELETLLNSAYFYLPYISRATRGVNSNNELTVIIEGGIIWWRLEVKDDGSTLVKKIYSASTVGMSTVDLDDGFRLFLFNDQSKMVSPRDFAQLDAQLAFARNLGVKTKEINDFKLSAQVVEVNRWGNYGINIGRKEGIYLDDGYYIIEYQEDSLGEIVAVKKGFVRISKAGDNRNNPGELSYAIPILGSKAQIGSVLMEHPRLGVDLKFGAGVTSGVNITTDHAQGYLTNNAKSIIWANIVGAYNLAPVVGVSQLFLIGDGEIGLLNSGGTSLNWFVFTISPYMGLRKIFGRRLYLGVTGAVGADGLRFQNSFINENLTLWCPGAKVEVELGFMVNPDFKLFISGGYKVGLPPIHGTWEVDGQEKDFIVGNYPLYKDMNMGGLRIFAGFSYSVAGLPVNFFGVLDQFREY